VTIAFLVPLRRVYPPRRGENAFSFDRSAHDVDRANFDILECGLNGLRNLDLVGRRNNLERVFSGSVAADGLSVTNTRLIMEEGSIILFNST
jgi:ATP-dependent DNA ligase